MSKQVKKASVSSENTEKHTPEVENIEGVSTIEAVEFKERLQSVIEKHTPEEGINNQREADVFLRYIGRQISNHFPETPTLHIINLLDLMLKGKHQDDAILIAIEEMPIGGYGY